MKRAALLGAAAATTSVTDAKWFRGSSSNGQKWEPAKATVSSSNHASNSLGWTPKPTPGPAEAILRHELLKRAAGTSTCGYFTGTTSPSAAIVCLGSSQCIVNDSNKAMGCCSSSNIQACNIATACIDSTDAASISTSTLPYTLLCQASTAPSCVTYSYATDSPYSGFRAFACGSKKELLTVAYTAPGAPSTGITSAAGATSTTTTGQNSLPAGGGNAPPITITSSTSTNPRSPSSANPASAGSPTTTTSNAAGAGSTSSPAPAPSNENSNNNTSTILAGVIGGVGGLVIILAGLLSSIFYARRKKKDQDPQSRRPIEKVKRPYMPAAFPNSFDYIAAYREARMSRRQSGRPPSSLSARRQSFVRSFRRRSSMLPFWRQSQHPQNQQPQSQQPLQQQREFQRQPSLREQTLPRRSSDRKIVNSSRFPLPPLPVLGPPPAVRNIRQESFDFGTGTRPSPTISVPVNRNARGLGPAPATPASTFGRTPITRLESGSTSTLARPNSMSVQTSPRRHEGAGAAGVRDSDGIDNGPPSAHTEFDSRFTPPFISPPFISPSAGLRRHPSNENIGLATVPPPGPAGGGGGGAGGAGAGRIVSTTGATAGSMSKHNSRALPSPRSPRAQQYMLYNPVYGRSREVPVKRPVGHLNKMQ
ncbi:hypothetical protein PG997_013796 [Apiospora hydei]|uniref:Mid2 domain-containing protein n=1 Tax=Apiospora hydei TaxID=1337664 RepID=A0ABR1V771_9PEZI